MKTLSLIALLVLLAPLTARAQHDHAAARAIEFPDVPGYQTLAVDLHLHTVFSDGAVWPSIRVQEAQRDGLDAIAVTDHLEYQPHADDIPHPDRNRSFDIAADVAKGSDLIVVRGSEITRDMPPGHTNAVFIQDANALLQDDVLSVFREARRQGAFIFWNHPNWTAQRPDGVAALTDLHRQLLREGLLDGIEVVNDDTYSDEALQIALDHDLTILGTSDIHGLVDWQFDVPHGGHRPVTLAFTTERTAEGLREALHAGRTAVWFGHLLIGREAYVVPLVQASLQVTGATYPGDTSVLDVSIENTSDAPFILDARSDYTFHTTADVVTVAPHSTTHVHVKTRTRRRAVALSFDVLNAVTAPGTHPVVTFDVDVD